MYALAVSETFGTDVNSTVMVSSSGTMAVVVHGLTAAHSQDRWKVIACGCRTRWGCLNMLEEHCFRARSWCHEGLLTPAASRNNRDLLSCFLKNDKVAPVKTGLVLHTLNEIIELRVQFPQPVQVVFAGVPVASAIRLQEI